MGNSLWKPFLIEVDADAGYGVLDSVPGNRMHREVSRQFFAVDVDVVGPLDHHIVCKLRDKLSGCGRKVLIEYELRGCWNIWSEKKADQKVLAFFAKPTIGPHSVSVGLKVGVKRKKLRNIRFILCGLSCHFCQ